jgi:dipeptidyl aminopeptidase/acylaminoacyl peptidase
MISRDFGDVENTALCALDPDGRETRITHGARVQSVFHNWTIDGKAFYISTNERDSRFFDLYRVDAATYDRKLLFQANDRYHFNEISRDERFALFVEAPSMSKADIFLYDLGAGEMKPITADEGEVLNCLPVFNRAANAIYYISDKGSNFRHVRRYDLSSHESVCLESGDGDVGWTFFSSDYRRRITFTNDQSSMCRVMKIYDEDTGAVFELTEFSGESIDSAILSPSGKRLAFYVNGDRKPGDIYLYDFGTASSKKLTENLNPEIDRKALVTAEVICFRSFDGLEIPCLLWRPQSANSAAKAPALVWVHGGPGGRMGRGYKGRIQYLVNQGYVVLGVNYRGSSGFGKDFLAADRKKHGGEPLWDCVMAKNYLAELDYVDSSGIGIIGASFGGFMVLAALTFTPEEFSAGVDICGPSNFLSLARSLPAYWNVKSFYDKLGDLQADRDELKSISPVFYANRIKKPLMILQGARDPRCPREQSDEMVKAIRDAGGQVEYLLFEDEAHGFRKRRNAIKAFEAIAGFLEQRLKRPLAGRTD